MLQLEPTQVSPGVSFAAAAVITYGATRSWRVTLAALATIGAAVLLMLAALVAVGWEFGAGADTRPLFAAQRKRFVWDRGAFMGCLGGV